MSLKNKFKNIQEETIYKIITFLLSSFLYTNLLPIMMFIIYMKQKSFFSYDFFMDGLFGLNVFYFFIVLTIILFIIFLTSSLFFITEVVTKISQRKKIIKDKKVFLYFKRYLSLKYKSNMFSFFLFFSLNIFISYAFVTTYWNEAIMFSYFTYLALICAIITIHFSILIFAKAKIGLFSLLITFTLITIIGIKYQTKTAGLVKHGLTIFGSAGKEVEITLITNGKLKVKGEILLLSPDNIFISTKENNQSIMTIIKRNDIIIRILP